MTDVLNLSAMILCHFSLEYPRFRYFLGYFIDPLSLTPIHRRFNKLITALGTAVENGEGMLDKEATSHADVVVVVVVAFSPSLMFWY